MRTAAQTRRHFDVRKRPPRHHHNPTIPRGPPHLDPPLQVSIQGEFGELEHKRYQTFNAHCVCLCIAYSIILRVFSE